MLQNQVIPEANSLALPHNNTTQALMDIIRQRIGVHGCTILTSYYWKASFTHTHKESIMLYMIYINLSLSLSVTPNTHITVEEADNHIHVKKISKHRQNIILIIKRKIRPIKIKRKRKVPLI